MARRAARPALRTFGGYGLSTEYDIHLYFLAINHVALLNGDLVFTDTVNNRVRMLKRKAGTPPVVSVSAASFSGVELAPESIVAAFGEKLATQISSSNAIPLPTTLGGTTVKIRDSAGTERSAPLFFVAPTQINYLVPTGTFSGPATITVISGDGTISVGTLNVAAVAPSLFTTNANGQGLASAVALRVKGDGQLVYEAISRFDTASSRYVPIPIDLGPATDQVFLIAYGTGWRFRSSLAGVNTTIGGLNSEVLFAGAADGYVGLDQCNLRIQRALGGRGEVNVVLNVDNKTANTVTIQIK